MMFFDRYVFQEWSVAFFLGWIVFLILFLAWGYYPRRRRGKGKEKKPEPRGYEVPTNRQLARNPLMSFLIVFYVGNILWVIGYIIIIGFYGGPIGG